jgi:hypothetical protein
LVRRHTAASIGVLLALAACGPAASRQAPVPPAPPLADAPLPYASGRFETVYVADDGTRTRRGEPSSLDVFSSLAALWVPEAARWSRHAVTAAADGSYAATEAPPGLHYLQFDRPTWVPNPGALPPDDFLLGTETTLLRVPGQRGDLSVVVAARPDLQRVSRSTPVEVRFTGMAPWDTGSVQLAVSSQADVREDSTLFAMPRPARGSTSYGAAFGWGASPILRSSGLPVAAKGDVVHWLDRPMEWIDVAGSAASLRRVAGAAALRDLTIVEGEVTPIDVAFQPVPLTDRLSRGVAATQFASLAEAVGAGGRLVATALLVIAVPHTLAYPDVPRSLPVALVALDVDWGAAPAVPDFAVDVPHGHPLPAPWREFRRTVFEYETALGPTARARIVLDEAPGTSGTVAPVLGPPLAPRIGGRDARTFQPSVGTEPVLSWGTPALGAATSYAVTIEMEPGALPRVPGETVRLTADVGPATSFRVPPGFLRAGGRYFARVEARSAPWDGPERAPRRSGLPLYTAECLTASFTP